MFITKTFKDSQRLECTIKMQSIFAFLDITKVADFH